MKRRGIVLQNHFAFPRGAERLVVLIAKGLGSLRVTWSSRTRSGQTFKAPVRPGTLGPYLLFPKALVDVAGKPFVVRQLEYLRRQGVVRVVLCLGHLDEQV
ncbi:MAG: hypothetical protein JW902_14380, partial [Syntrophaceae bacterium]|nr:hypothetical protein [Syntrophaceae bacterium]